MSDLIEAITLMAVVVVTAAWLAILPAIGLLWCVGWLS